jgi:predicted hydrolase (HD superfamily)
MYKNRAKYLAAVKTQLERNIFFHSLALEACMGGIYDYLLRINPPKTAGRRINELESLEPKKEEWMLAGLIHDIDYSGEIKATHPQKTLEVLAKYGLTINESIHRIVRAHAPELTGCQPQNKAEWAIFCADSLTGLIVATALVYPSKKLADVKLSSVLKRFKEPKFAAGTRREDIRQCERAGGLNIKLEKFVEICLESMKAIASEIGL